MNERDSTELVFGEPGFYEDWLMGNRRAFEILRDKIDQLLESESDVFLDGLTSDISGISLKTDVKKPESTRSSALPIIGCIAIAVFVLGIGVLGVIKLIELCGFL